MVPVSVTSKETLWTPLRPGNVAYWLTKARPGDKLIYHVGNLMVDRARMDVESRDGHGVVKITVLEPLNTVAREVWEAAEAGLVTLSQKRLGENLFQYEARRSAADWLRRAA